MGMVFAALAGMGVILSAVYTLRMIQKVLYGNTNQLTIATRDIFLNEKMILAILVILIVSIGIYPQPLLDLTGGTSSAILKEADITQFLKK